jgi:alkaline phosphatase D
MMRANPRRWKNVIAQVSSLPYRPFQISSHVIPSDTPEIPPMQVENLRHSKRESLRHRSMRPWVDFDPVPCQNKAMRSKVAGLPGGLLAGLFFLFVLVGCSSYPEKTDRPLQRIAFGSCINTQAHPMLDRALSLPFDLFILLGDNIYADTTNAAVMAEKYRVRKESAFFRGLKQKAPVVATWDDHDYGWNDAGAEYPMKRESQKMFLDFMDEPALSPRRLRDGIYHARLFGPPGQRVQVILLDTRYFRSLLTTGENNVIPSGGKYIPRRDPNATMLGEEQWEWLEKQLRVPAELRIIASSIQFISEFSGGEAWANLPREKERLLGLLRRTYANGVLFISGDRHWAELSRLDREGLYPLYDLTSSALTEKHKRGTPTPNQFREGPTFHDNNVGLLTIDWSDRGPAVRMQIIDAQGQTQIEKVVRFQPEK